MREKNMDENSCEKTLDDSASYAVKMVGITKRFSGVVANQDVHFNLKKGEIHALLGENGAGKTTLMNILYGIYRPDKGEIYLDGRKVEISSPSQAIKHGIGMIHQHFMLVYPHTVLENICLGTSNVSFFLPTKKIRGRILDLSRKYGLNVDLDAKIWQLSAGEQQKVEILKTLYRDVKILILDEPTSVLSPIEVHSLISTLKRMKMEGKSIVFVTHKLQEALEASDRITILRKGKVVSTVNTGETSEKELVKMMFPRERVTDLKKTVTYRGKTILEVKNLTVLGSRGAIALKNVSFQLHEGEILGIAGVSGNGQKELAEAIAGLKRPVKGEIYVLGRNVAGKDPRSIMELGVAYIPENRVRIGVIKTFCVAENLVLRNYYKKPFSNGFMLNGDAISEYANKLVSEYKIMTPSLDLPVQRLSGGNIQRLILAR